MMNHRLIILGFLFQDLMNVVFESTCASCMVGSYASPSVYLWQEIS